MIEISKFCLCADTEDNHPNYLPGWKKLGTNYDKAEVEPKFDWLKYWDQMISLFKNHDTPVTWFLRVDTCLKDKAIKKFKPFFSKLDGHEFGIHIHTLVWDGKIWRQTIDPETEGNIVKKSVKIFAESMGHYPKSSRMGWNAMSNSIMTVLQDSGIKYDCTAVPGYFSEGFYGGRDNIIDWRSTPNNVYHPSANNYRRKGNMKIFEVPISSMNFSTIVYNNRFSTITNMLPKILRQPIIGLGIAAINSLNLNAHSNFVISPHWNITSIKKLIDRYVEEDKLIIGYFHPSDILHPSGKLNKVYLKKLHHIVSYLKKKGAEPSTISDAMRKK